MDTTIKKKGPIRWEAIIPLTVFSTLVGLYFHFVFDHNLKSAIEWLGYKALGSEVNVTQLKTSVWDASFRLQGLEITDAAKPQFNSIAIGDIRYSLSWDALLRLKFVVNEAAVEDIRFQTLRKYPGKVKPPEPPSTQPSFIEKEAGKLKDEALNKAQEKYDNNVFGDIAALLGGGSSQVQLEKLQSQVISKNLAQNLDKELKIKQKSWEVRIKNLPQSKDVQALSDRLGKIKSKDFKSIQELQDSIQQFSSVLKDADDKYKQIQSASNDLTSDLNKTDQDLKALEAQIRQDIKDLEKHFRIPQIDSKAITRALFQRYTGEYFSKFNHYKDLAEKYLPPNLLKKDKPGEADEQIQPKPRAKGITYEFGRKNSYPLFWVKKTSISSQAGASPDSGNVSGQITDITSNPVLVGRPTIATIKGDFPQKNISGLFLQLILDNVHAHRDVTLDFKVASYPIENKDLLTSDDVQIAWQKASGNINSKIFIRDFKDYTLNVNNQFLKIDYLIKAKNNIAEDVLKTLFAGIPVVTVDLSSQGVLPNFPVQLNSNLGDEVKKGLEKQINAKIEEAKKKLQAYIDQQVGQYKTQIDGEVKKFRAQFEGEINKVKAQLDSQKKQVESKTDQAKKDTENKADTAKKEEEQKARKKLEEQAKKAAEDLKKKFGF
ncbi:MAG: TIGR03545 family protein [Pseudobdellovibrionaceae bacterium]